jgi:ribose 5-phosphate isomerase B
MRIAVACDHAGFPLKNRVVEKLLELNQVVIDLGTDSELPVDFPDYAEKAGRAIQKGEADRAIIICGSGVGASIAANKMQGIYAGVCHDTYSAHQGVEHDNMNALCLGARIIGEEPAKEIVEAFVKANFCEDERFIRRTRKIRLLEQKG